MAEQESLHSLQGGLPEGVDPNTPNMARIYDAALGGKNNFAVDREIGEQIWAMVPGGRRAAIENRAFLRRAVSFLARSGVRQFLDLGSGLPTQGNVHEVALGIAPDAKVVYVDWDPVAVAHSRALLAGTDNAIAIQEDVRRPDVILAHPEVRSLLDFSQPMAVLLVAVLHSVVDADDPTGMVRRLRDAMAPGSYLVISHLTSTGQDPEVLARIIKLFEQVREPITYRSHEEVVGFFDGLELLEPGVVPVPEWRPDAPDPEGTNTVLGGVGHKR
jgi:S-adenosyl methyltransferase